MNNSNAVELVIESATSFYSDLKKDENGRYRSWEHCYYCFCKERTEKKWDDDYMNLQLAFYLASWGMYRGSSFLLQKDYKVHEPVVKEILKDKYDLLVGINCSELKNERSWQLLDELSDFLREYYDYVRKDIKGQNLKSGISDTLITKILMGTLGCVPAYDRYFIDGIKKQKVATGNYNKKSIRQLVDFYENNMDKIEAVREKMKVNDLPYPQMKLLDMGLL